MSSLSEPDFEDVVLFYHRDYNATEVVLRVTRNTEQYRHGPKERNMRQFLLENLGKVDPFLNGNLRTSGINALDYLNKVRTFPNEHIQLHYYEGPDKGLCFDRLTQLCQESGVTMHRGIPAELNRMTPYGVSAEYIARIADPIEL